MQSVNSSVAYPLDTSRKQQKNARVVVCVEARERVAYNRCGVGKRMELMGIWATKSAQREKKYGPLPGGTISSFEL